MGRIGSIVYIVPLSGSNPGTPRKPPPPPTRRGRKLVVPPTRRGRGPLRRKIRRRVAELRGTRGRAREEGGERAARETGNRTLLPALPPADDPELSFLGGTLRERQLRGKMLLLWRGPSFLLPPFLFVGAPPHEQELGKEEGGFGRPPPPSVLLPLRTRAEEEENVRPAASRRLRSFRPGSAANQNDRLLVLLRRTARPPIRRRTAWSSTPPIVLHTGS